MSILKALPVAFAVLCFFTNLKALPLDDSGEKESSLNEEDELISSSSEKSEDDISDEHYTTEYSASSPIKPGYYRKGDMVLPKIQPRNAVMESAWPNAVVPYEIDKKFSNDEVKTIKKAMRDFHKTTCVKFVPRSDEDDYVFINKGDEECESAVGYAKGKREMSLSPNGCVDLVESVIHELMHMLGFKHEHSRHDRDKYVKIQYKNIKKGEEYNFDVEEGTESFGLPYDFGSIMHYSSTDFSRNKEPTIVSKLPGGELLMGKSKRLSAGDIMKIRRLYECED